MLLGVPLAGCPTSAAPPPVDVAADAVDAALAPPDADGGAVDAAPPDDAGAEPDVPAAPDAPGAPDAPDAGRTWPAVWLNEIDCHGRDWIELAAGAEAVELGGWALSDGGASWNLPAGLLLGAGGFLVLRRQDGNEVGFTFGVACREETISLLRPDGSVADAVPMEEVAGTWGRLPDRSGPFQETEPTPGAPNRRPQDEAATLFDPFRVVTIDLSLPAAARAALDQNPRRYVEGTFRLEDEDGASETLRTGIRLRGSSTWQGLESKASFRIKFDEVVGGQRFRGLRRMTLGNAVVDPSFLCDTMSHRVFRELGVPAPRTGYAWVRLDGVEFGLYVLIEAFDEVSLARHYPSTRHLYEGAGADLGWADPDAFQVDEGDPRDRNDLAALIEAALSDDDRWLKAVGALTDLDDLRLMWAGELFINHWDGYASAANNYFLHSDRDGRFTMLPWGTDQTFGNSWGQAQPPIDWHQGNGYLFGRCLRLPECRGAYDAAMRQVVAVVADADLDGFAAQVAQAIGPYAERDPRTPFRIERHREAVAELRTFLAERIAFLGERTACLDDEDTDKDDDGHVCSDDCDDLDPTIHPRAGERCGDGIDQDCDGLVDEPEDCDCRPRTWNGRRYWLCTTGRPYADAKARCAAEGAAPVVVQDEAELQFVRDWVATTFGADVWLGLGDGAEEGVFVWEDGSPLDYAAWGDGEPSGGDAREDCVALMGWNGLWMDLWCDAWLPIVCEAPCTPGDADGDGHDACVDDCDDGDPTVHPGAIDLCADGVDQDCDGATDVGPDCPDCRPVLRGGHRYWICADSLSFAEARRHCQEFGSDLLIIDTIDELTWLRAAVDAVGVWGWLWTGLGDALEESAWVWWDGTPAEGLLWMPGQPDDGGPGGRDEDCAVWLPYEGLMDVSCHDRFVALCEDPVPPGTDEDGDGASPAGADCDDRDPTVHSGAADLCGDGIDQDCDGAPDDERWCWEPCLDLRADGVPFLLCLQARTWEDARAACRAWGAELAWFDGLPDQESLRETALRYVPGVEGWIGLSDREEEGRFVWTDGRAPADAPWAAGQPNDGYGRQDCVRLLEDGTWNDVDCAVPGASVCRFGAPRSAALAAQTPAVTAAAEEGQR
jgi:hypothetical protein